MRRQYLEGYDIYSSGFVTRDVEKMKTGQNKRLGALKLIKRTMTSEEKSQALQELEQEHVQDVNKLIRTSLGQAEIKEIDDLFDQMENELRPNPFYKEFWFWLTIVVVACVSGGIVVFFVLKK